MAKKHMKRRSTSLIIRENKWKLQWGTTSHRSEWPSSKSPQTINAGKGVENIGQLNLLPCEETALTTYLTCNKPFLLPWAQNFHQWGWSTVQDCGQTWFKSFLCYSPDMYVTLRNSLSLSLLFSSVKWRYYIFATSESCFAEQTRCHV